MAKPRESTVIGLRSVNAGHDLAESALELETSDVQGKRTQAVRERNVTQTPLDRYISRKSITQEQYQAGERLRRDWELSGIHPRVISDYGGVIGTGGIKSMTDRQVHHWQCYKSATTAVGPTLAPILSFVCCFGWPAREWALTKELPPQDGMAALRLGLDALLTHYEKIDTARATS